MQVLRGAAAGVSTALALAAAAAGQDADPAAAKPAGAAAAGADAAAADAPSSIDYDALNRALDAAFDRRCDGAHELIADVSLHPAFETLSVDDRSTVLRALLECQRAADQIDASFATAGEIWRIAPDADWAFHYRLNVATEISDPRPAAEDLLAAIRTRPDLIAEIKFESVERVVGALERAEEAADIELELLTALETLDWTPPDTVLPPPQWFDVRRALLLAEAGDLNAARAKLAGVTETYRMIEVLIDRRYEPLWEDFAALHGMDAHAAAEIEVADTAALMQTYPDHLEPIVEHMRALQTAGRAAEAVEIGQRIRPELLSGDAERWLDRETQANWILNTLGYALEAAGDRAQARVVLRAAAAQNEDGVSGNVSQAINSALSLVREGRGAEALNALDQVDMDRVAKYGQMFLLEVRACAAAQDGRAEDAGAAIGEMLARSSDNSYATLQALLCVERIDEAAEIMTRQLEDPGQRGSALYRLQIFEPPSYETAYERTLRGRFDQVRAHPDVQAAADRYGRILTWNIADQ